MKKDKRNAGESLELRQKAEARLHETLLQRADAETETSRLLHELEVHQIELEMQNETLCQARDEREAALEKYTELYEFAPVGYVTLERDGTITAANLTVTTLLGVDRPRLIGRCLKSFITAKGRPAFTAFLGKVFSSQVKESCEVVLLKGGALPVIVLIEAVAAVIGQECLVVIIDISERRKLEASLVDLHANLIDRSTELENANIDLEAFNYSVSHDLREPLTIIAGYCGMVEEFYGNQFDEKSMGYIRAIHEGVLSMNQLINTLLTFSSVKCVEIQREKTDLSKIAEEVALSLKRYDPERRVRLKITKGLIADGDADLLRVVLTNLIGNAWKYSAKQEESLIEFGIVAAGGKQAYFVRDNGAGFDMAHSARLFLPFQQLPGTEAQGHGIGLAIVDRIVKRHGGRVWAESILGEGATFFFDLG